MKSMMTAARLLVVLLPACWIGFAVKVGRNEMAVGNMLAQDNILKLLSADRGSGNMTDRSPEATAERADKVSDMEKVVMMLAQQQKAARAKQDPAQPVVADDSANISQFVSALNEIIAQMLADLLQQVSSVDDECRAIIEQIEGMIGCPYFNTSGIPAPPDFNVDDMENLRVAHKACREQTPSFKDEADSCAEMRAMAVSVEANALANFNELNVFESPEECVPVGESVEDWLRGMWQHFEGKRDAWWSAYYALGNASQDVMQWRCSDLTLAFYNHTEHCAHLQLQFENMACDLVQRVDEQCDELHQCRTRENQRCHLITGAGTQDYEEIYNEWHALKRMECLLEAFAATDMDAAIDACG